MNWPLGPRWPASRCKSFCALSWSAWHRARQSSSFWRRFGIGRSEQRRESLQKRFWLTVTRIAGERRSRRLGAGCGPFRLWSGGHLGREDRGRGWPFRSPLCPGRGHQHPPSTRVDEETGRQEATAAARDLLKIDLELAPFEPFAERIWELRNNVTSYDAWYV